MKKSKCININRLFMAIVHLYTWYNHCNQQLIIVPYVKLKQKLTTSVHCYTLWWNNYIDYMDMVSHLLVGVAYIKKTTNNACHTIWLLWMIMTYGSVAHNKMMDQYVRMMGHWAVVIDYSPRLTWRFGANIGNISPCHVGYISNYNVYARFIIHEQIHRH